MKKFLNRHWLTLTGIAAGAIAGFFYWKLVGCQSGQCMITSKPLNSMVYFSVMGGLLFSMWKPRQKDSPRQP